ncbi:MAG: hypothetical protein AAF333_02495 [Planctomycetota bacterium]
MKNHSSGYTLLEVLVAVVCVLTISSLVLSSRDLNRRSANTAKCLNNLRQINIGLQIHADTNDSSLPQLQNGWPGTSREVVSCWSALLITSEMIPSVELFDCPELSPKSSPFLSLGRNSDQADPDWKSVEYGINAIHLATSLRPSGGGGDLDVSMTALQTPASLDQIRTPGETIALVDAVNSLYLTKTGIERGFYSSSDTFLTRSSYGQASPRHVGDAVNVAWLDGHVTSKLASNPSNPYSPDALTDGLKEFGNNFWDRD